MKAPRLLRFGLAIALGLTMREATAADDYLCAQLDRIRAEENMPAIGAGLVVPEPEYPAYAPLPSRFVTCASGVTQWGGATKVTEQSRFEAGSARDGAPRTRRRCRRSRCAMSRRGRSTARDRRGRGCADPSLPARLPGRRRHVARRRQERRRPGSAVSASHLHGEGAGAESPAGVRPQRGDGQACAPARPHASQPPRIVEIAAAAIGGTRSNLPFWYRHGFEKVLSPPQGPRVARPVEVARELR